MATYHEDAGKGSHRRKEDKKAFESNYDKIDWGKKERKAEICKVCHGERGSFDAGHWYECTACCGSE